MGYKNLNYKTTIVLLTTALANILLLNLHNLISAHLFTFQDTVNASHTWHQLEVTILLSLFQH
jgi:hypothetical protein